jgi:hypothetical protein
MLRADTPGMVALLTVLVMTGSFSMSLYLPSMPSLATGFGTDAATVMLTLISFLALHGLALRRPPS